MARRIHEHHCAVIHDHFIGANMLRDAARFARSNIRFANRVQQTRLARACPKQGAGAAAAYAYTAACPAPPLGAISLETAAAASPDARALAGRAACLSASGRGVAQMGATAVHLDCLGLLISA